MSVLASDNNDAYGSITELLRPGGQSHGQVKA